MVLVEGGVGCNKKSRHMGTMKGADGHERIWNE